jgi:hypothetical protein
VAGVVSAPDVRTSASQRAITRVLGWVAAAPWAWWFWWALIAAGFLLSYWVFGWAVVSIAGLTPWMRHRERPELLERFPHCETG